MIPIIETPTGGTEIVRARELFGKSFDMGPATGGRRKRKIIRTVQVVHVPDDIDAWRSNNPFKWLDVNTDLVLDRGVFRPINAWHSIEILENELGYKYVSKQSKNTIVKLVALDDVPIGNIQLNFNPTAVENRVTWTNVVSNILDVFIQVDAARVRVFKRIKSASAPRKFTWEIIEDLEPLKLQYKTRGRDNEDLDPSRDTEIPINRRRPIEMIHTRGVDDLIKNPGKRTYEVSEQWGGRTVFTDPKTRIRTFKEGEEVYPIVIDQDITEDIVANVDDGHEDVGSSSWVYDGYGFYYAEFDYRGGNYLYPGFRFRTIPNINSGDTIDAATLRLDVAKMAGYPTYVPRTKVHGDDVDDAPLWSDTSRPSQATPAGTSIDWDPNTTGFHNIDVQSAVQAIVNRAGWAADNDMRFWADNDGADAYSNISIADYDYGAGGTVARLTIDYTAAGGYFTPIITAENRQRKHKKIRR